MTTTVPAGVPDGNPVTRPDTRTSETVSLKSMPAKVVPAEMTQPLIDRACATYFVSVAS